MASLQRFIPDPRTIAVAILVTGPAFSSTAIAAGPEADASPAPTPDAAPPAATETISAQPSVPAPSPQETVTDPAAAPPTEGNDAAVPEPTEGAVPEPEASSPPATEAEAGAAGEPPASEPAIDPSLLDGEGDADPAAPVKTRAVGAPPSSMSPEERDAAIEAAIAAQYRPADNPVRLNIAARALFANMGGQNSVGGRMGGATVDVGPAWNHFGVAATFSGWGGRLVLPEETGAEMNGMLGGGLSLGLGRLALLSRGYLDLRVGYDVYYGVVNRRSDASPIVAPQGDDPQVVAALTDNLLPHGPRLRLDMGLVGSGNNRYFHGLGMSMGYQALVGSFRGDLPFTSMLMLGFSYYMG